MTHDITHCQGNGCPIKDSCIRYQAHVEVEKGIYKSSLIAYFKDGYLCDKANKAMEG